MKIIVIQKLSLNSPHQLFWEISWRNQKPTNKFIKSAVSSHVYQMQSHVVVNWSGRVSCWPMGLFLFRWKLKTLPFLVATRWLAKLSGESDPVCSLHHNLINSPFDHFFPTPFIIRTFIVTGQLPRYCQVIKKKLTEQVALAQSLSSPCLHYWVLL